jgi:hypothetical protein
MKNIPTFSEIYTIVPVGIRELLDKCENTPQSPKWHPEGPDEKVPHNVLVHTKIVYERARRTGDLNLTLAALFHDLGKVRTTKLNKVGGWSAYGHEFVSAGIVNDNRGWIALMGGDPDEVHAIVKDHMRIKLMDQMRKPKRDDFLRNPYFSKLEKFTELDSMKDLTPDEIKAFLLNKG